MWDEMGREGGDVGGEEEGGGGVGMRVPIRIMIIIMIMMLISPFGQLGLWAPSSRVRDV
jgi:hypothetical protein